jgi:two-component system CheB/CheR fusion protein
MTDVHPADIDELRKMFISHFKHRKPFTAEYRLKRHDGEYRWIQDMGRPTFLPDETFSGYTGSCTEIHDKKIMNDELELRVQERTADLQDLNMELARSNSELQQFAYVASHDLQEPLRKIMTFSDRMLLYKDQLPAAGRSYLDKITVSSQRMTRLIDDLLNFSRISRAGKKFVPTDLNKMMAGILTNFELIIAEKKAKITYDLPTIQAIPVQMEQLFHNLIGNALKFAKPDVPPVITIVSRIISGDQTIKRYPQIPKGGRTAEIIVKDNGIGFEQKYADQIFIIFQRLNDRQHYPGTGIGLALCRRIVSNHHGEITVVAREGEGAEFRIVLPVLH